MVLGVVDGGGWWAVYVCDEFHCQKMMSVKACLSPSWGSDKLWCT